MSTARAVVVMAKLPKPGRVKTRLAARWSPEIAAALYRAFLTDVLELVGRARALFPAPIQAWLAVALDPGDDPRCAEALVPAGWRWMPQPGGDLGARIEAARRGAGAAQVVILGSDAPTMRPERIVEAFAALDSPSGSDARTVVVGPTRDGGYDLIGFSGASLEVLEDVPWSTPCVLETTRARAAQAGVRLVELGEGYDIDEPEDLLRALADASQPGSPAVLTRQAIQALLAAS